MKQFVSDLKPGEKVESFFSVKYKHPLKAYKKGFFFELGLSDKTGEIELTYWGGSNKDAVEKLYSSFSKNDIVFVSGSVSEFNNAIQIDVNEESGFIEKRSGFDLEDFVPVSKRNLDEMVSELNSLISSLKNPFLKKLLENIFSTSFIDSFKKAPAAMYIHHAYVGGLLEHTLNVVKISKTVCSIYSSMDEDLVVAGAILHDIGKTKEFCVSTNIGISEEGLLRGHVILGEEIVSKEIEKIPGFPEVLKLKLLHIVLSHHGTHSFGAPREPAFPEATAVYYADETDSKVSQFVFFKENALTEDFHAYAKRLGQMYLK